MSKREGTPPDAHLAVRPYLAARPGELDPAQARALTEHLSRCPVCAAEAAGFHRIALALAAMRELELEPPAELLEGLVAAVSLRRPAALAARARTLGPLLRRSGRTVLVSGRGVQDPRLVAAAAGAGGALVATAVVAGVLRSRRRGPAGKATRPAVARSVARLLRRPERPALSLPALGAASARAR
jgi:anti-sigma factor RsiW